MINEFRMLCQSKTVRYADMRVVRTRDRGITWKDRSPGPISESFDEGFGIRVVVGDRWGFCASSEMSRRSVQKTFQKALKIAKSGHAVRALDLGTYPAVQAKYHTPIVEDPFELPLDVILTHLETVCREILRIKGISIARAHFNARNRSQTFVSSEGSSIEQDITETGAGMYATAINGGDVQVRSYPNSHGGNTATAGYEFIRSLDLVAHARQIGEEAVALLKARPCPDTTTNVLIGASQLALQVHESLGHSTELDRLFNMELSLAGSSFLDLSKLGSYQLASDIVNVTADATVKGGLGTFGFDDEGVKARKVHLIKNGMFRGYQSSRETAALLGQKSSGAMRADGWSSPPLVRMTNINLAPGNSTLDELLEAAHTGIMLDTNRSWSIDDKRLNFQFATEIAWEIKRGRKGRMLKNANYTGRTPAFWRSCTAIGNNSLWSMWGLNNCGKGEPMQEAHVGHGASPAVFTNVHVGSGRG